MMAWNPVPAKLSGDIFDLATYDIIRANDAASAPGIVAAKGDLVAGTAANAIARVVVGADDSTLVADSAQATGVAWQIQPSCRVYNDAAIDTPTAAWFALTFNQERWDTDGMHSVLANTSRLTVPAGGDGIYMFGGNVLFDISGSGDATLGIRIRRGGTTELVRHLVTPRRIDVDMALAVTTVYDMVAGQYVELEVYHSQGRDAMADGNFSPEFWAMWLRRA